MQALQQTVELSSLPDLNSVKAETHLIGQYFALFNLGKFQQISKLFTDKGQLCPPFESSVVGREAIATYLVKEADGMQAHPLRADAKKDENGNLNITVFGKVTALVFHVNVAWHFTITPTQKIERVKIDLLASLGELLNIRPA